MRPAGARRRRRQCKARPSPRSARRYAAHSTPNPLDHAPAGGSHSSRVRFAKAGHPKAEAQGTPLAPGPTDRPSASGAARTATRVTRRAPRAMTPTCSWRSWSRPTQPTGGSRRSSKSSLPLKSSRTSSAWAAAVLAAAVRWCYGAGHDGTQQALWYAATRSDLLTTAGFSTVQYGARADAGVSSGARWCRVAWSADGSRVEWMLQYPGTCRVVTVLRSVAKRGQCTADTLPLLGGRRIRQQQQARPSSGGPGRRGRSHAVRGGGRPAAAPSAGTCPVGVPRRLDQPPRQRVLRREAVPAEELTRSLASSGLAES